MTRRRGKGRRLALALAAALVTAAVTALVAGWLVAWSRLPRVAGEARLPGLGAGVTVRRDTRGVPHIRAAGEADAMAAAGFVHAQDRFFQMDLARRAVAGRLSEIVGRAGLPSDRRFLRLGHATFARRQLGELGDDERELLEAYARGINAGLADTGRPVECLLLGYHPEPWRPLDTLLVVKYMEDLLATDGGERERANLASALGPELASYLGDFQGLVGATILPEGYDGPQAAPPVSSPSSSSSTSPPTSPSPGALAPPAVPLPRPPAEAIGAEPTPVPGSNSWVVAGTRTRSGKPLLANDPHLPAALPAIFYELHLSFPGVDVAGMSIPGAPWVVIGHNGRVGWGLTVLVADEIDWVELELAPDGRSFRGPNGDEALEIRMESIAVKGGAPETWVGKWSRHGPLVEEGPGRALARSSGARFPLRTLRALRGFAAARNVADFLASARDFSGPGHNLVAADVDGHIAWYPGVALPRRRQGDGRLPLPGADASAGFDGVIPAEEAPLLLDPERGYIVTANNRPGEGPRAMRYSSDWALPMRADRITELILARPVHDAESMAAIQGDARSRLAQDVIRVMPPGPLAEPRAEAARALLAAWDGSFAKGPEPALFELFWRELRRALFEDDAGALWPGAELGTLKAIGAREFRELPASLSGRDFFDDLGSDAREDRDAIFAWALTRAAALLDERYGSDPAAWDWQRLHVVRFPHPLRAMPLLGRLFELGALAVPGASHTVCATAGRISDDFRVSHLPAFRMVLDFSDLAASRIVLSTGQSGHRLSRHFGDQAARWARTESYPMWYREADIAAHTAATLELRP